MEWGRENSKEEQITVALSSRIRAGELAPGERLQSVRTLAKSFQTSLSVINRAFDNLEKIGMLERRPRSGVFVRSAKQAPKKAALILDYLQDIHALFPGVMQRALAEAGYLVTLFDTNIVRENPDLYDHFLSEEPELIVFDGWYYFPVEVLNKTPKKCRTVCFHRCEIELPAELDCTLILADMFQVGYRAAKHLLDLGKRRILILHSQFFQPDAAVALFCRGARQALAEAGLQPLAEKMMEAFRPEELLGYLTAALPCDGVIGLDSLLKNLLLYLRQNPLPHLDELAVVGYNNTPWSESYHFPSLDLQPEKMAQLVAQEALKHSRKCIHVEPRLVFH